MSGGLPTGERSATGYTGRATDRWWWYSMGRGHAASLARCHRPRAELGIKLLAPDRPGFGSSSPAGGRSIAAISGDLLALVDHLGFRRFGLVAQSGGTPYALAVAAAAVTESPAWRSSVDWRRSTNPTLCGTSYVRCESFLLARRAPWVLRLLLERARSPVSEGSRDGGPHVREAHCRRRSSRARRSNPVGDPRHQLGRDHVAPSGRSLGDRARSCDRGVSTTGASAQPRRCGSASLTAAIPRA